ncbi:unnamed protein product [Camellia sinensis]
MELLGLEDLRNQHHHQQQQQRQLIDELTGLSSPYSKIGELKPTNLDDIFGSLDPSLLSQLQGLSPKVTTTTTQLQSPTAHQIRQNMNQRRASYPTNLSSSPARKPSIYGFDSSGAVAASGAGGGTAVSEPRKRLEDRLVEAVVGGGGGARRIGPRQ